MIHRINKLLSVIISFCLIVTAVPADSYRKNFLATPGYTNCFKDEQINKFMKEHGRDNPIIFTKDGVTHLIFGVQHSPQYPEKYISSLILKDDIITTEGYSETRKFLFHRLFRIICRLPDALMPKTNSFRTYENELAQQHKVLNLDIVYKQAASLSYFLIIHLSSMAGMIIYAIYSIFKDSFSLTHMFHIIFIYTIFICIYVFFARGIDIDTDFRNLFFATKLDYLHVLLNRDVNRIVTINGRAHKKETAELLLSDVKRNEKWEEYANSFLMRRILKRKIDILESMEIWESVSDEEFKVIGTIADLPGPKKLITSIYGNSIARYN